MMTAMRLALLAQALTVVHGLRVDQLVVSSGLCTSRGAAKIAISQGLVTTRQGVVLRKASANLNDDTVLVLLDESLATASVSEEEQLAASRAEAIEEAVSNIQLDPLAAQLPPELKKTSAARAARFRNVKPPIGAFGDDGSRENSCNANGLQGRGNKNRPATKDGVMSKKYSKKNKRGSSLT
eukprot:scaffold53079_cov70-Phaeocystis_antarctica.AAC.2